MLITLLCIIIFLTGVGLALIYKYKVHDIFNPLDTIATIIIAFGGFALLTCLVIILSAHIGVNADIYDDTTSKTAIVKQLQTINSEYEKKSQSKVIQNAYEWNSNVYSYKYWSDNPWTNWFHSKERADSLEYIDVEKEMGGDVE